MKGLKLRLAVLAMCSVWGSHVLQAQELSSHWAGAMEVLRSSTAGEDWVVKSDADLINSETMPNITLFGGNGHNKNSVKVLGLACNNLTGNIPEEFNLQDVYGGINNIMSGQEELVFSHNRLTAIHPNFYLNNMGGGIKGLKIDHNRLETFQLAEHNGAVNWGITSIDLRNNQITHLEPSNFFAISNDYVVGINAEHPVLRLENNYLNFQDLIALDQMLAYRSQEYYNDGVYTFGCYPQKALGGDPTLNSLAAGETFEMNFSLIHPDNVYTWIRNGYSNVQLFEGTKYTIEAMDASKAGVYNCIVTNPAMPGVILYSHDFAVWYDKGANTAPEEISISNNQIAPAFVKFGIIGELSATDADNDEVFFRLVPGKDDNNSSFRIIDGNILISSEQLFEYEAITSYQINVQAYDCYGGICEKTIDILPSGDVISNPITDISFSGNAVNENEIGAIVGEFTVIGGEELTSFSLVEGKKDNQLFSIEGNVLKSAVGIDFEKKAQLSIQVRVISGDQQMDKVFNIDVLDQNDAPHDIILSSNKVLANQNEGELVGFLMALDQDPNDTEFNYSLVEGDGSEDNLLFTISNNQLKTRSELSYNPNQKYLHIRLQAECTNGGAFVKPFAIEVMLDSAQEEDLCISNNQVNENAVDALAGMLSINIEGDTDYTFSLVEGEGSEDNDAFEIIENKVFTKVAIDYEQKSYRLIRVKAEGRKGVNEKSFEIKVNDVPEAPYALGVENYLYNKGMKQGDRLGYIFVKDPDRIDEHSFELSGDAKEWLEIKGDEIYIAKDLTDAPKLMHLNLKVIDPNFPAYNQEFVFYSEGSIIGINEIKSQRELLKVFPNPCVDSFSISFKSSFKGEVIIEVVDMTAQLLKREAKQKAADDFLTSINMAGLKSGIYIVNIIAGDQSESLKLFLK